MKNIVQSVRNSLGKDKQRLNQYSQQINKTNKNKNIINTIQSLEDWFMQIDNRGISIISDSSIRLQLISNVPNLKIAPLLQSFSSISSYRSGLISPIFSACGPPLLYSNDQSSFPTLNMVTPFKSFDINDLPPITCKGKFDLLFELKIY